MENCSILGDSFSEVGTHSFGLTVIKEATVEPIKFLAGCNIFNSFDYVPVYTLHLNVFPFFKTFSTMFGFSLLSDVSNIKIKKLHNLLGEYRDIDKGFVVIKNYSQNSQSDINFMGLFNTYFDDAFPIKTASAASCYTYYEAFRHVKANSYYSFFYGRTAQFKLSFFYGEVNDTANTILFTLVAKNENSRYLKLCKLLHEKPHPSAFEFWIRKDFDHKDTAFGPFRSRFRKEILPIIKSCGIPIVMQDNIDFNYKVEIPKNISIATKINNSKELLQQSIKSLCVKQNLFNNQICLNDR